MKKKILHRIILMVLAGVLSVAFAIGQDSFKVNSGSVKKYKIDKPGGQANYIWEVYNDIALTSKTSSDLVELSSLGAGNDNEILVKWKAPGSYYLLVSVTGPSGCFNNKAWHFIVDPDENRPVARIQGEQSTLYVSACNNSGQVLDASSSTGNELVYSWNPPLYLSNPSSASPVFLPGASTRYHLTVTDKSGRKDTASILIVVADSPQAITDKNVYVEAPDTPVLVHGTESKGAGLTYSWSTKEGLILEGETKPDALISGPGKYYLQVTDSLGCSSLDSVDVGLYIQAINDTAYIDINKTVNINVLRNDLSIHDLDPSSLTIVTEPLHGTASLAGDSVVLYTPEKRYTGPDEFIYSICDYSDHCTQANVLVLINDIPMLIPEAFSPNGDGINDRFEMDGLEKYSRVEIEIFNRWGNIVYQSKNYGKNGQDGFWDGTATTGLRIDSGPVPSGTYYYILKINGQQNITGAVYLDR